jgi:hypothetical protein
MEPVRPTHLWFFIGNKFVRKASNSPCFDWDYQHTPGGSVHYRKRKNARDWSYVPYGQTPAEVAAKVNRYVLEEVAKLELQIARLRTRLVWPGGTHEVVT